MLRLLIIATLCCTAFAQSTKEDLDLENIINQVFGNGDLKDIEVACNGLAVDYSEKFRGCFECYPCNHSSIARYRTNKQNIQELSLLNLNCDPTTVCCVSQSVLLNTRIGSECGMRVETGHKRPFPRSILQGEYPWHAFVYQKTGGKNQQLCSASYINDGSKALLTTAACVKDKPVSSLYVSFSIPPGANLAPLERVIIHENYQPNKHQNDIAMLKLTNIEDIPQYVKAVCIPEQTVPHSTVCSTVASNQYRIQTFIPRKKVCERANNKQPLDKSQLCASTVGGGDYLPQNGAGLFCEPKQFEPNSMFFLYGIVSYSKSDSVSIYTNVTHHADWISRNL